MTGPPTILFQPPNSTGLGHISRLMAIALAARRRHADVHPVFAVEGDSHGLLESADLPYLTVPSYHGVMSVSTGHWRPWPAQQKERMLAGFADAIVRGFKPAAIVFDCFPFKSLFLVAVSTGTPIVLSLRKMNDTPRYYALLEPFMRVATSVILPHEPGEVDVPEVLRAKMHFVGRIRRPSSGKPHQVRWTGAGPKVVITGGGGGYRGVVEFLNQALAAMVCLRAQVPDLQVALVTGPLFHDWGALRLAGDPIVVPFEPDMPDLLRTADLVICQAGYNTIAEVLDCGVRTLCVPASRDADNQFERAAAAARDRPTFRVAGETEPGALAREAAALLAQPHVPVEPQGDAGADRAAALVLQAAGLSTTSAHDVAGAAVAPGNPLADNPV